MKEPLAYARWTVLFLIRSKTCARLFVIPEKPGVSLSLQQESNNELGPQWENLAPALREGILLCPWCPEWTINDLHCDVKGHAVLGLVFLALKDLQRGVCQLGKLD